MPVVPSSIKNKIKREQVYADQKAAKSKLKLQKRQAQAKLESADPSLKKERLATNVPQTIENTREKDDSLVVEGDEEVK